MNTGLRVVGVVVVSAALLAGGLLAGWQVAQAQAPAAVYPCCGGATGYAMPGAGWMVEYHDQMQAAIAKALGITADELDQALRAGKSPWQIAQEKGMTAEQFQEAMLKAASDVLAQAVKDAKLTQAQADAMLARMKQYPGMGFGMGYGYGYGRGMGPGMMGRGRGYNYDDGRGFGPRFGPGYGPGPYPQPQASPTPGGTSS